MVAEDEGQEDGGVTNQPKLGHVGVRVGTASVVHDLEDEHLEANIAAKEEGP